MKRLCLLFAAGSLFTACSTNTAKTADISPKDTLTYAYHALYSSDITVPGDPVIAQRVLTVWKLFETAQIQAMRPYFADLAKQ